MLSLLAGLMMLVAATVPPLPFHSYADVPGVRPLGPMCDEQVMRLTTANEEWTILSTKERDIFIHLTNGSPDYVYFVVGTSDPIVVRDALTYDEALQRYPQGACPFFQEKDA